MPPEWHPHRSTWLAWPKNRVTWPTAMGKVQETFLDLIGILSSAERVNLLVDTRAEGERVWRLLRRRRSRPHQLCLHVLPTADCWIRDYGPSFLLRRTGDSFQTAVNVWRFNAWGGRYPELKADARVPGELAARLGLDRFATRLTLEGGAIDINGKGCCLASGPCLLNPNRNPGRSRASVELDLKRHLGVQRIVWLGEGIIGDDTDAHVDQIARFVSEKTIVLAQEEDPSDPNFQPLRDNWRRLRLARDTRGLPFELVPLPMPIPLEGPGGRLPASYANFYLANGLVVFPLFGVPQDFGARDILGRLFPGRRIVGLDCREIVHGRGALHCLTQQQPG